MTTKGCSKYTWWVEWHGTIFSCYFTTTSTPSCKICKKSVDIWKPDKYAEDLIQTRTLHCSHFLFPSERGADGAKFSNFCGPPTRRCHTHTTRQLVLHLPTPGHSVYSTQPRDWAANLTTLWSQPCQSSSGKLSSGPVQSFSEHASNFFIVFVAQLSPLSL